MSNRKERRAAKKQASKGELDIFIQARNTDRILATFSQHEIDDLQHQFGNFLYGIPIDPAWCFTVTIPSAIDHHEKLMMLIDMPNREMVLGFASEIQAIIGLRGPRS